MHYGILMVLYSLLQSYKLCMKHLQQMLRFISLVFVLAIHNSFLDGSELISNVWSESVVKTGLPSVVSLSIHEDSNS